MGKNFTRTVFLCCLLLSASGLSLANANEVQSPAKSETSDQNSVSPFDAAVAAAKSSMMSDPQSALENAKEAESLASSLPVDAKNQALATSLWLQGESMTRLNRPAEAIPLLERATGYLDDSMVQLSGDLLLSKGRAGRILGKDGAALEDFQNAYRHFETIGASRSQAIALQSIGTLYDDARRYERAIEYYTKASDVYSDDAMLDLVSLNNRALAYRELGDYASARDYSNQALAMAAKSGSSLLQARILTNIAVLEVRDGRLDAADQALKKGFVHAESEGAEGWAPFLWGARAMLLHARGDLTAAAEAMKKTFDGVELAETPAPFRDFHEEANVIYAALGEYRVAHAHLEAFKRLDDQGRNMAATANRAILSAEFEFANQELKIEKLHIGQLERDIKLRQQRERLEDTITLAGSAIAIGVIAFFMFAYRSSRKNQKITEAFNRELETKNDELTSKNIELQKANQTKTEFLATTSHEIRTPLNAIIGLSDVMLSGGSIAEQDREYLTLVNKSGRHLLDIVNDILDVSKLESGKLIIEKEPINVGGCVNSVVEIWRKAAEEKGLNLAAQIDSSDAQYVSDGRLIRQIVSNLMSNAVKFTEQGDISVEMSLQDETGFEIVISDTGIGVPVDLQEKIFESFRQADGSLRRKFEGTGLGLAICKRIAQALGGDIAINSVPGEGSTFAVFIPAERVRKDHANYAPLSSPDKSVPGSEKVDHDALDTVRVLVAEDNAANAMVVRALLGRRVKSLDIAANGAEAVKMLQGGDYDVVLMDKQMPVMDGIEATKAIRTLPCAKNKIPIIAVTADAYASARKEVLNAGMNDYVSKPLTADVLCGAMVRNLQSNTATAA